MIVFSLIIIGSFAIVVIPPQIIYPDIVITLVRTACFGTCPDYQVAIYGDGTVYWNGEFEVKFDGKTTGKISIFQVYELINAFEKAKFFSMQDYDSVYVTDHPWAVTSITLNGKSKTISHYYGDRNAPLELYELECKIDEAANTNQWIGRDYVFCREWMKYMAK